MSGSISSEKIDLLIYGPIRPILENGFSDQFVLHMAENKADLERLTPDVLAKTRGMDAMKAQYRRPATIPFPKENPYTPEKAALGKKLYFDTRLSVTSAQSCASCHSPGFGWGDGLAVGVGHGMTIIEGDTSLIIVDVLLTTETARAALELYYQYRPKKPVGTVIYSHSHGDHYGGVKGVINEADVAAGKVQVLAPSGFMNTFRCSGDAIPALAIET